MLFTIEAKHEEREREIDRKIGREKERNRILVKNPSVKGYGGDKPGRIGC